MTPRFLTLIFLAAIALAIGGKLTIADHNSLGWLLLVASGGLALAAFKGVRV